MNRNNSDTRQRGQNASLYIFECIMSVIYLIIAYTLLFMDVFKGTMSNGVRIGLGVVFAGYGVFRVYRAIKKSMKKNEE